MTKNDLRKGFDSSTVPEPQNRTPNRRRGGPRAAGKTILWVIGGIGLMFIVAGAATSGVGGAILFFGLTVLVLGLVVLTLGRRLWGLAFPRRAGAVLAAAGLVAVVMGAWIAPHPPAVTNNEASSVGGDAGASTAASSPTSEGSSSSTTPTMTADQVGQLIAAAGPLTALTLLGTLDVRDSAPVTGYVSSQFGQTWADVDSNGCDTRNDILARDLTDVVTEAGSNCLVKSGKLTDPYTAAKLTFVRNPNSDGNISIDHVVALANAWTAGAQDWDASARQGFANDPLLLLAVGTNGNDTNGAAGAAAWLPPNAAYRCDFVARQVAVKAKYGLSVTVAERSAAAGLLRYCPSEEPTADTAAVKASALASQQSDAAEASALASRQAAVQASQQSAAAAALVAQQAADALAAQASQQSAAAAALVAQQAADAAAAQAAQDAAAAAAAAPPAAPAPAAASYANCTAARAAGVTPLHRGDPGYASKLDRDGDGIACE